MVYRLRYEHVETEFAAFLRWSFLHIHLRLSFLFFQYLLENGICMWLSSKELGGKCGLTGEQFNCVQNDKGIATKHKRSIITI